MKNVVETWTVAKIVFHIVERKERAFSVSIKRPGEKAFWLKEPEADFETEAGGRLAILLWLQNNV